MASLMEESHISLVETGTRDFVCPCSLFGKRQRGSEGERDHRHSTRREDGGQEMTWDSAETSWWGMRARDYISHRWVGETNHRIDIPIMAGYRQRRFIELSSADVTERKVLGQ